MNHSKLRRELLVAYRSERPITSIEALIRGIRNETLEEAKDIFLSHDYDQAIEMIDNIKEKT